MLISREAISSYIEALKQCPYALECVLALVELGIDWSSLRSLYARNSTEAQWLSKLVESHQLARRFDYNGAALFHVAVGIDTDGLSTKVHSPC